MSITEKKKLEVSCPKCGKRFDYYSSASRPFCSDRCKLIDFGHWMNETYKVPLKESQNEEEQEQDEENEVNGEEDNSDE